MKKRLCIFFAIFLFNSIVWSQTVIVSTFNTDNEDWTVNGGIMYYQGVDGNPDGFIEFEDDQDGAGIFIVPEKFLGNLSYFQEGSLSFDLKNTLNNDQDMLNGYGKVRITSSVKFAEKNVVPLEYINDWTTFSIPLNSEEWGLSPAGWDSILAEVTEIYIQMDAQWNYYDRTGLDNFKLSPNVNSVGQNKEFTKLYMVYPNPFSSSTALSYELRQVESVMLTIYDQMGKRVYQTQENQPQGKQQLIWNAEGYGDGIYYYSLRVGEQIAIGKLVKVH